uniref:Uncharacterized protein n=1 Tax=Romanomermis culicivorax TaxID=13658 RepID=A0A915J9G9_ROMCU
MTFRKWVGNSGEQPGWNPRGIGIIADDDDLIILTQSFDGSNGLNSQIKFPSIPLSQCMGTTDLLIAFTTIFKSFGTISCSPNTSIGQHKTYMTKRASNTRAMKKGHLASLI